MAKAAGHLWGQIIGNAFEEAVKLRLAEFANNNGLYLDMKGQRAARGSLLKAAWTDAQGNLHDLDFVLEKDGSDAAVGRPVAFVECAWRRYTRHSRNKAQEIQGAILPIVEQWKSAAPLYAAALCGVFTHRSITQLKSLGFRVIYLSHDDIFSALNTALRRSGLDATFDETTPDADIQRKVDAWRGLSERSRNSAVRSILAMLDEDSDLRAFLASVAIAASRQVEVVRVLPLHGNPVDCRTPDEAIRFVEVYLPTNDDLPVVRYEVQIRYDNGDKAEGAFNSKEGAIEFLRKF